MSKAQKIAKLKEIIRELIKNNLEEVSTAATAGIDGMGTGHYDTPKAFASSASGSEGGHPKPDVLGYKKVNEDVINEFVSVDNFNKDFNTAMNLVVKQAKNLKGPLAKHPIKRNINKLTAVQKLFNKFIASALVKKDRSLGKGFDLTKIKKELSDGKFKSVVQYLIMPQLGGQSYDSNSFFMLDDKEKKLLDRLWGELRKLVNIMDDAQLENINEADPNIEKIKNSLVKGLVGTGRHEGGLSVYSHGSMISKALDQIGGNHSALKRKIKAYGNKVPTSKGKSEAKYKKEVDKYKAEGDKLKKYIVMNLKESVNEASTLTLRGKNGKMVDVPRKFASIISGIDRGMSKFNPRGVMFGHRKYHKLKPNDEYSGSIVLKNPLSKKDIDDVMKQLKRIGSSLGFKFEKITFNPDRNEPFIEFRVKPEQFNESVNEVTDKEITSLQKLYKGAYDLRKGYIKIMSMGDKELKDKKYNKNYEAILELETVLMNLIRELISKKRLGEGLNEGRYHNWRNDESMTPKQKIGISVREVRDALTELDKTIKMNLQLKTELNMDGSAYWKNTHKALTKISERLVKLAGKVGNLK